MKTDQIIKKYIPCTCSDMYKDRHLSDVDCVNCNYSDLIEQIINECSHKYVYQFRYTDNNWYDSPSTNSTHSTRKGAVLAKIKHKKRVIRNINRTILTYDIKIRKEMKQYQYNTVKEQMSWDVVKVKLIN